MKVSYHWLTEHFDEDLPAPEELADTLTMHAYEVEGIKKKEHGPVLDIDVLPDRAADSLSHRGIAREVATLLGVDLDDTLATPEADADIASYNYIKLSIESEYVRRATKRYVKDIEVTESPEWMQERLKALGISPINNIVDITNYIMLATGQPVHAFDYDKLAGDAPKQIVVREAEAGESITTLDGESYELKEGMLVIADEKKPLDIAGIKGGQNSHIDEGTERVMLSVCNFDPSKIRRTSRKLNLRTDASKRFENNISPKMAGPAMEYLAVLVEEHADGSVAADICDLYPDEPNPYTTGVSVGRVNNLLGTDINQTKAKQVLERCHCEVEIVNPIDAVLEHIREYAGAAYRLGASVSVDAPDVFDCSSLVAYVFAKHGGVSVPRMTVDQFVYGQSVDQDEMQPGDVVFANTGEGDIHYKSKEYMPGTEVSEGVDHCGIYLGDGDIIHTNTQAEVVIEKIDEAAQFSNIVGVGRMVANEERLRVQVPYFRQDLRGPEDLIEEIGRVYGYENIQKTVPRTVDEQPVVHKTFYYTQKIRDILADVGLSEVYTYAFQPDGEIALEKPISGDKGYLRESLAPGLLDALEKNKNHKELLDGEEITIFETGNVFEKNQETLQLGFATSGSRDNLMKVLTDLREELGIDDISNYVLDESSDQVVLVNLDALISELPQPDSYDDLAALDTDVTYKDFSRYPYVLRDIAFWCPEEIANNKSQITNMLQEAAGDLLVSIKLFDEYDPDDQDRVSVAYRLVFQSDERTLEDNEVNEIMDDIYAAVEQKGWEVR